MVLSKRTLRVYQDTVRNTFSFLKATSCLDELYTRSIPLADQAGYLLPVCKLHTTDSRLIEKLATWRTVHKAAFPSQFPVTIEGTMRWLRNNVLNVPDRILFLVVNPHGEAIGHLGYANAINDTASIEIDNVVRGVNDSAPGIMSLAMRALLDWGQDMLGPAEIYLRVFSDNIHAIQFYERLGFKRERDIPLHKHVEGEVVRYTEQAPQNTQPADKFFTRMVFHDPFTHDPNQMILTAGPSISARETSYAYDAARTGWNNNWSGYLKRFEKAFADYLGMKYALPVASGTGALHITMLALGIGHGDEVIVPDLTWAATANAVAYAGATPVFADVEPGSWCLDAESFESLITERTKAVIPVHLYGHPARMDRIMEVAARHHLSVIEDAAPAIGAEFEGKRVGTFGHYSAFSFQGAKLLVCGEGGMLLTNDDELYEKAYKIWHIGSVGGTFWLDRLGLKYKMANVQAAIGLGQLEHVDEMIEDKRRIFGWYAERLADVPGIRLNFEQPWARSIYWMTSIVLDARARISRDSLRDELKKLNIDTRPVFPAISQYPYWKTPQKPQPNALWISNQGINLPSGVKLRRPQIDYICRSIRNILKAS